MLDLIVVMPVFNEAACIESVIQSWISVLREFSSYRLLIIDDGSVDDTPRILDSLAKNYPVVEIVHQKNSGHGNAVINGYKAAVNKNAQWIFQADSDDQIPAQEFTKLWNRRNESPFILGMRYQRKDPWHRLIISALNRWLIFLTCGIRLSDPNIPFRLMKGDFLKPLLLSVGNVFAPNIFLSIRAEQNGAALLNIPVEHQARMTGIPSLQLKKLGRICIRCVAELLRLRRQG